LNPGRRKVFPPVSGYPVRFPCGGGGNRSPARRHPASSLRAGEVALASIPGGSIARHPHMIGCRAGRLPVRFPCGGGGNRSPARRHPASSLRAGEVALASIPGGSIARHPHMIGCRAGRLPVRFPCGGGGNRTPVPGRVPRASTGLSGLSSCRGGGGGPARIPSRIPESVPRPLRAETGASLGWLRALRPLEAAQPGTRRLRYLRSESEIAVVVGN